MTVDEVLELLAGIVLALAAGALTAALVPPPFTIAAGLGVLGACLFLLSVIAERAHRPSVVQDLNDASLQPGGRITIGGSDS